MTPYMYVIEILTQSRPHSQPPLWLPPALSAPVGCDDDDASSSSYAFLSPVEKGREGGKKRGRKGRRKEKRKGGKEGRKEEGRGGREGR